MKPTLSKIIFSVSITGVLLAVASCGQSDGPSAGGSGTTIEGRFEVRGPASDVVRDIGTGLEWQRCSLGQTWNGRICTGQATNHSWNDAHMEADRVSGWRLPTKDELQTLVYCSSGQPERFKNDDSSCSGDFQHPTIVPEAFPNTPRLFFWSGSPSTHRPNNAWAVDFIAGAAIDAPRVLNHSVRLVRGGE